MAEWSLPLDQLAAKIGKDIGQVVRGTAILMFQRVVMRSPVDTGRFRANWNVSYGQINTTTTGNTDQSGSGKSSEIASAVLSMPIGGVFYLANSLPYAGVLEYGGYPNPPLYGSKKRGEDGPTIHVINGYSMQAPNGMVRVTAQEFSDAVARAVKGEGPA